MASDSLSLLAVLFLASSEGFSSTRIRLSGGLLAVALALLLAAFRRSYLIVAIILTAISGMAACLSCFGTNIREDSGFIGRIILRRICPPVLAGFFHLVGVWVLPFLVVWGWTDTYSDRLFFIQDIGHLVPASFYYLALVLFPLLIIPRGYERGEIVHQLFEGAFNFSFAIIYFIIFRLAHWSEGENPPKMTAPNWDHEFLGLVWAGSGATGVLTARAGYRTSAHVAFPAAFICYSMLTHSNTHHEDMTMMDPWKLTWMKLHKIHGICFGVGALCRLMYRIPEAVLFFFLGSFVFVFSSKWVSEALYNALNYTEDGESGYDPNNPESQSNYPADHVAGLLVVTLGAVLFPAHLATLSRLRSFVEKFTETTFKGLPHQEESFCEIQDEESEAGEMAALTTAESNGNARGIHSGAADKELSFT